MEDVGQHGRTVILVSHDMPAITRMCSRAILLNKGQVVEAGPAREVVNHYLHAGHIQPAVEWPDPAQAPGNEVVRLQAVRVKTGVGHVTDRFDIRKPIELEVDFQGDQSRTCLCPGLQSLMKKMSRSSSPTTETPPGSASHAQWAAMCPPPGFPGIFSRKGQDDHRIPHDDRRSVPSPCPCASSHRVPCR